jgi:hypothetical protein
MTTSGAVGFMFAIFSSLTCAAVAFDWLVSFVR